MKELYYLAVLVLLPSIGVSQTDLPIIYTPTTEDYIYPSDIVHICDAFISIFADAAANFTKCFLEHSRPIELCKNCIGEYLIVNKAYSNLEETNENVPKDGALRVEDCNSWILNADRVMAIQMTKTFYEDLWSASECENCFASYSYMDGIKYETAEYFVVFQQLNLQTHECFRNFSMNSSTIPGTDKSEACIVCHEVYEAQNGKYSELNTMFGINLCMDIVDSMNYTRLVWSTEFNCTGNARQDGITITVSVLLLFIPAVFYIASYIHYQRLEKKIVKQNRMRRVRTVSGTNSIIDVLSSDSYCTAPGPADSTTTNLDSRIASVELHASPDSGPSSTLGEMYDSTQSNHLPSPYQSYSSIQSQPINHEIPTA
ncbi:osteopetrosis-associated transmembrane protein 1-like [Watersipora subatra]|uniref:osteopetrosis-associated transmembrane protein 1-like n=1 Tax=Watersipora subatra TaxID=2589382 RepID=UPI00355B17E9